MEYQFIQKFLNEIDKNMCDYINNYGLTQKDLVFIQFCNYFELNIKYTVDETYIGVDERGEEFLIKISWLGYEFTDFRKLKKWTNMYKVSALNATNSIKAILQKNSKIPYVFDLLDYNVYHKGGV